MKRQVNDKYSPDAATMVADTWKSFGGTFKELATDFSILVNGSQSAWTGQAADGVRQALNKIGTFVDQTGDGFTRTRSAIEHQREAAVAANKSMPEPVDANPSRSRASGCSTPLVVLRFRSHLAPSEPLLTRAVSASGRSE